MTIIIRHRGFTISCFRILRPFGFVIRKLFLFGFENPDSMDFGVANPEERGIANPL